MTTTPPGEHGGKRPGAGRPPKAEQRDDIAAFHQARTRKETALAELRELEAGRRAGRMYDRGEVLRVFASAVAIFAEQIRSLPDTLERRSGITPEQAARAEEVIDTQLDALRTRLLQAVPDGTHLGAAAVLRAMAEQLDRRGAA